MGSERGTVCLGDVIKLHNGKALGYRLLKNSSGLESFIALSFPFSMTNRCCRKCKIGRHSMAKSLLIWAIFKTTECVKFEFVASWLLS